MKAQGPDYYDGRFRRSITLPQKLAQKRYRNRIVAGYVTGSVLDLGCGLGLLADLVGEQEYLGVDFSPVALQWAREYTANPNARFWQYDICALPEDMGTFDTVVLCEVLEHVEDPQAVADIALRLARQRVVVVVPVNMPGGAHLWPTWDQEKLETLLGELALCRTVSNEKPKMTEGLVAVKIL